mmetsp:Transcript_33784/g.73957  ORF Transcript_33784/g.73957 Transcript_33784/m.73957 type:complete len:436 (+) Transcript_33784:66-1373(+)|eukprot:CAMPEP_0170608578 /NCGR_PEP_ID=MMETSP0224-20130122/21662_1 /TAXON_ID=285029 /ORGANISM="Togula jolla, Strain CCCM 725" /LENGTH=435 /DNA_ID=CAMNT_0010933819 /DNA_START=64 /DNA_END=1371 /DNA_ORIENTATION=+
MDVEQQLGTPLLGRRRHQPLGPLYATMFVRTSAYAVAMLPAFTLRVNEYTTAAGYSMADAATVFGTLTAARHVSEFIAAPMHAAWSDRIGRKRVMLFGSAAFVVEAALMAAAPSLHFLSIVHVLGGLMSSGGAVESSCITDATSPGAERSVALGRLLVVMGGSVVIGPAIGGALAEHYGGATPFLCGHILGLISLAFTACCLPEYLPKDRRALPTRENSGLRGLNVISPFLGILRRSTELLWYAGAMVLTGLAMAAFVSVNTLWLRASFGWGPQEIGHFTSMVGLALMASQAIVLPRLLAAAKGHEGLVLQGCLLVSVAKLLSYAMAPQGSYLYLALFATMPAFCSGTLLSSVCTRHVPEAQQGLWAGGISAVSTAANIVGSIIGSHFLAASLHRGNTTGWHLVFGAGCYVLAAFCALQASQVRQKDKASLGVED